MRRESALVLPLVLVLATTAHADKLRVPGDFDSIQEAVDAANPGDVIEIKGRHDEAVDVDAKQDLTFVGKGNATVRPGGSLEGFEVTNSTGITFRNIRFETGDVAIVAIDCAQITIERCRARNVNDVGFFAVDSTDVTISKCRVENSGGFGIQFGVADGDAPVARGLIEKCFVKRIDRSGYAVVGTDIDVQKCRSDDTKVDGFAFGASNSDSTDDVRVDKCRVRRSDNEGYKVNGTNVTFTKCSADIVEEEGFDVEAAGCRIVQAKTKRCRNGIEFEGTSDGEAVRCKLLRNDACGITIRSSTDCLADGCKVTSSGEDGIRLDTASTGNTVKGCKVSKSDLFDLRVENGPNGNTTDDNKVKTTTTAVFD